MAKKIGSYSLVDGWVGLMFGDWVYISLPIEVMTNAGMLWLSANASKMTHETFTALAGMSDVEIGQWLDKKGQANAEAA